MYEEVHFEVTSTHPTQFAVFQLFAKGLMKISKIIPIEDKHANFTIIPKFSHTPKAHCIIFFIDDDDGQIISDSITLHFDNILPNCV